MGALGRLEDGEVRIAVEATAFGARDVELAGALEVAGGGGVVGRVVDCGAAATEWRDRRVIAPRLVPCGECRFCRRGAPQGCPDRRELGASIDGGLAGEVVARGRWLSPADGELEVAAPTAAILGDDALLAYTFFCRAGVAPGEPAVVVGSGPRSAIAGAIAAAKGARVARAGEPKELDAIGDRDGFEARPWRVFALDGVADFLAWAPIPAGSTIAVIGAGAFPIAAAATVLTGELGHPDLLPELVALVARGDCDLDEIATWCERAELDARAPALIGAAKIPVVAA